MNNIIKRQRAEWFIQENPELSNRTLAEMAECSEYLIRTLRKGLAPVTRRTGADGKVYPCDAPQAPKKGAALHDYAGNPIPIGTRAESTWNERGFVEGIIEVLDGQIRKLVRAEAAKDKRLVQARLQEILNDMGSAKRGLKSAAPFAVCPACGGNGCKACRMRGMISEFSWRLAHQESSHSKVR
jgi:hypothetical protein